MAFPEGPTKKTQKLTVAVKKFVGKKGKSLADIASHLRVSKSVARRVVVRAIDDGALSKLGDSDRKTVYAKR